MRMLLGWLVLSGCAQGDDVSRIARVMEGVMGHVLRTYYIPAYAEESFRPPSIILRRCAAGSIRPSILHRGSDKHGVVALTFDACATVETSGFDTAIVRILLEKKTPATMFLGGQWVLDHPGGAKMMAAVPFFEMANHSYLHGHLTRTTPARRHAEIRWAQDIIHTVTGVVPRYFRPPYVEWNDSVAITAATEGLVTVIGDLPSGDPHPGATSSRLLSWLLWQLKGGSIVIMHVNTKGRHTAAALPAFIDSIRGRGLKPVTLSDLPTIP